MRPSIRIRPTPVQAVGWGGHAGLLMGAAGSAVAAAAGWGLGGFGASGRTHDWLAVLLPLATGIVLGVVLGLLYGRQPGTEADSSGLRSVPEPATDGAPGAVGAAWRSVADLRRERHGGRVHVAVYLHDGRSVRLPAPYHGRLLAADPEFEHKLFLLRHLWETHRHARGLGPGR